MRLDRFQLEFFYQSFELEGIQLLFPALGDIVVHEIDGVPDKIVNKKGESAAENKEYFIIEIRLFAFVQQVVFYQQLHIKIRADDTKYGGDQDELDQLPFQLFLQQVELDDDQPHQVGQYNTQCYEDPDPAHHLRNVRFGVQLVEGIGKKDTDQGETTPADPLE